jgi:predicted DNA-binding ribbon-helix-helix protein
MRRQLTVQLEEDFYLHIQKQAEERKVSMSALIRERLKQLSFNPAENHLRAQEVEKLFLDMQLQTLGLVRFLVTQINEALVKEAIEKSNEALKSFYSEE